MVCDAAIACWTIIKPSESAVLASWFDTACVPYLSVTYGMHRRIHVGNTADPGLSEGALEGP
jgi:hypothetical protein